MKNQLKNNKGVTLIALVVTIVILIILAAVSMTMVLGNNGIFTQAQKGANSMASAEANTQEGFNSMSSEIDKILGENDGSESSDEWISKWYIHTRNITQQYKGMTYLYVQQFG